MTNGISIKELLDQLAERDKAGDAVGCVVLCEQILELLPREKIPELWAAIQGTLADKLLQSPTQGPDTPERAISHYELALEVLTEEANGQQWAANHGQAGNLYMTRVAGDRAHNLARAIDHFRSTLHVFDQDPTTMDWAATHASIGEALAELGGHPLEVIDHLDAALAIITKANKPNTWLMSKIALAHANARQGSQGNARAVAHLMEALPSVPATSLEQRGWIHAWIGQYRRDSADGETADGMDEALTAFEAALADFEAAGIEDGMRRTHAQLGHTYADRVVGDCAENVAKAIEHLETAIEMSDESDPGLGYLNAALGMLYDDPCCSEARSEGMKLELREKEITHYKAALASGALQGGARGSTHARLGLAYASRTEGDRSENLGLAIEHLEKALDFDLGNEDRARTHRNLSIALRDRAQGDSEDIERSLEHGHQALVLSDPVVTPLDWADAQRTLGESYLAKVVEDRAENVEAAIACFEAAHAVVTHDVDSERWANVHLGLAGAHSEHPNRTRDHRLASATHCRKAQRVFTRMSHPELWRQCEEIVSSVLEADPGVRAIRELAAELNERVVDEDPFAGWPMGLLKLVEEPAEVPRGSTLAELMAGMIELFAPQIRGTVVSRFGGSHLSEDDVLKIRVVDDWEVNAQVATEPPYDIYISTNLFRYCSTMSELLIAGLGIQLDNDGSQVGGDIPPTISLGEIAVHVQHIMKEFLREQEIPLAPTRAGPGHMVLKTQIFFSTMAFLISHEFGHVIIAEARRRNEPPPFYDFAEAMLEAVFDQVVAGLVHPFDARGLEGRDDQNLDAVSRSWAEEIACDVLGASLALEFQSRDGPWAASPDILSATKFGIHLALVSQMMLSLYSNLAEEAPLMTPTHPPMDFRTFCVLKWMYGDRVEEAEQPVAEYVKEILASILSELVEPSG